jgi:predicted deacylase
MAPRVRSPITSEIDFDADGKQSGFLRLPHSVHRSAYGWLPIPIAQVRNGAGPTLFLMSGNHGDEYEGQVTLTKLIQALEPDAVRGRIILLPMANYPAAKAGTRTSPIDDGNLNRSFPGDPDGTVTQIIAHYIEHVLLAMADFAIDLHSGGSSLHYLPTVLFGERRDATENAAILKMMRAFGAPYACRFARSAEHVSSAAARRQGVAAITVEMGGSATVSMDSLKIAENGVQRVMASCGLLTSPESTPADITRTLTVSSAACFVYAEEEGLFEPRVDLGDEVQAGQVAGMIHTPEMPWKPATEVRFKESGLLICKRVPARVERGDCLFHLGTELSI